MIQIQALHKSFGPLSALRGIDLQVPDGQFLTIFGPNGAGKTTLLRILATLLRPTRGDVYLNGHPLTADDPEMRRQIGYLSDRPLIYPHLTAEENLYFFGRLYDVSPVHERVDSLLQAVGLQARRHSTAGTLSRGLQQRLSLARSLLHQPAILLLDEPFTGLDPQATAMLEDMLLSLRPRSQTVIMTIHNLEQGWALCDRLVILARGSVAFQAERTSLGLSDLREAYQQHTQGSS
jgi:heme exporter protein A